MWLYATFISSILGITACYNTPPPLPGSGSASGGNSQGNAVPPLPSVGTGATACTDSLDNCDLFGANSCKAPYVEWAKANCAATCNFCTPPTTSPPECEDTLSNCQAYDKSVCSDPKFEHWAKNNCRAYCRICTTAQLEYLDAHTTTISPDQCVDKVDCRLYGRSSCSGDFEPWARANCPSFCGICSGAPTPSKPCADKNPDCARYDTEACTNLSYRIWAEDNCSKFCGFCGGGTSPLGLLAHSCPRNQWPPVQHPPRPGWLTA